MNFRTKLFVILFGLVIGGILPVIGFKYWQFSKSNPPAIQQGNYVAVIEKFNHKYVLFTDSTCDFCKKEKEYLNSLNISYKEIVVDRNKNHSDYFYNKLKEKGVPALFSKNRKLIGFYKPSLDEFLSKSLGLEE